jgi:transglutaminase-like putative cysteine protease
MPKAPAQAGKGVIAGRVAWAVGYFLLRAVWVSTMVLTPLFGFWLASSLAAYNNASQWLSLLLGLALFPLLPIGWEAFAAWRRTKQKVPKKQILTRLDRLVLRTLVINGVFLVIMMWTSKATAIRAIAQRGDWMLDGHDGAFANKFRGALLALADKLDRKPVGADDHDRYGDSDEAPDPNKVRHREDEPAPEVKPGAVVPPKSNLGWPLEETIDPRVENMPEALQVSIESVGTYLRQEFPDKKQRVKAIHDYVALRLHYDDDTLNKILAGNHDVPSQEAGPVFAARTAVCAGYAKLMSALGAAAGLEIKYVTGYIRDSSRRVMNPTGSDESIRASLQGVRHAWNAVLLDDEWHLIDTTWDDPTDRSGTGGKNNIRTTYLFTPPKLFAYDHIPEDPAWQLVMKPISMGDWARAPMMSPEIGKFGLVLESPTRSQVTVSGEVDIVFDNPYGARVEAGVVPDRGKKGRITLGDGTCKSRNAPDRRTTVTCKVPDGEYAVEMFAQLASDKTRFEHVGTILVNSR